MIVRAWYSFWIWLLYATRLRRPLNTLQRRLAGEGNAPVAPVMFADHPGTLREVLATKQWRQDGIRLGGFLGLFIPLDYVSRPAVTQARLNSRAVPDGDCDDLVHWAAVILKRMRDVGEVYHVSIGYRGGAHVACVYQFQGRWWLLNYGEITALQNPRDAKRVLLEWAARVKGGAVGSGQWLVFETTDFVRVRP